MSLVSKFIFNLKHKILAKTKIPENIIKEEIEKLKYELIEQDVSFEAAEIICEKLSEILKNQEILRDEKIDEKIKKSLISLIDENLLNFSLQNLSITPKPFLILFFGINGSGKTTAIAKTAYYLKNLGYKVVLAAGDTFRAASIEQLEEHAKKLGVPVVKFSYGHDPAAVIYEAKEYAKKKFFDIVLADTSGRMPTNENLVRELKKIVEVTEPNLKVLVLDLTQGRDIYEQIELYDKKIRIDCVIFTKYDIDKKLGVILSELIVYKKPVLFISCGQNYEDIKFLTKELLLEI